MNDFYVWASSNILYQILTPGRSYSKIYYFNTAFQKVPQIFITSICYDLDAGYQGFQFYIYDISTTSFSIQIVATSTSRFNGYCFRYQAFDDSRRQVISFFNQQNPVTTTQKYAHSNPSFNLGIISPISLSYLGAISYHLSVVEVTQNDYTYSIEVNGLIQIGYQILLGTKDAFYHQQYGGQYLQTCFPCTIPQFTYQTGLEDSELYSLYTGISFQNSGTLRMRLNRYDDSSNLQNTYRVETWSGSYLISAYHRFGSIRRNWQPDFYSSFKCYDFQQVRYQDSSITNNYRLSIIELSIDTNTVDSTNYQIFQHQQ